MKIILIALHNDATG